MSNNQKQNCTKFEVTLFAVTSFQKQIVSNKHIPSYSLKKPHIDKVLNTTKQNNNNNNNRIDSTPQRHSSQTDSVQSIKKRRRDTQGRHQRKHKNHSSNQHRKQTNKPTLNPKDEKPVSGSKQTQTCIASKFKTKTKSKKHCKCIKHAMYRGSGKTTRFCKSKTNKNKSKKTPKGKYLSNVGHIWNINHSLKTQTNKGKKTKQNIQNPNKQTKKQTKHDDWRFIFANNKKKDQIDPTNQLENHPYHANLTKTKQKLSFIIHH